MARNWETTLLTVLDGIAKPMPTLPAWPPADVLPVDSICELTPITWPWALKSGPPELPGLIAASVCRTSSIEKPLGEEIWRCSAEMTPVVSVRSRPKGLPIAYAGSPTCTVLESPSASGLRLEASTFSSARSVEASWPTSLASSVLPSPILALIEPLAPSTTWALVTM